MRNVIQGVAYGASVFAFAAAAFGVTSDFGARYDAIPRRNIFGLKPMTKESPATNAPPDVALPKITLTGITTILGNKLALFRVQFPAEQGKPPKEDSLVLTEGQREGGIEVLQIDEKAGRIRVNNSGHIMPVEFDKDAMKTSTNAAPAVPGGAAPASANPFYQRPSTAPPPYTTPRLPSRSLQMSAPPASAAATSVTPAPTAAVANSTQPNYASGYAPATNNPTPAPPGANPGGTTTAQPLSPTGFTPEDIATLHALANAANQPTQAVQEVPAPLTRPPTMPLLPQ